MDKDKDTGKPLAGVERLDRRVTILFDRISSVSVVAVVAVTVICVIDVAGSKIFSVPFAPAYAMTQLLSIPLVFFAAGSVQMGRGMMRIDLIANKFPAGVQRALTVAASVLGVALCIFLAWRALVYTQDTLYANSIKTTGDVNLYMWPFGYILFAGLIMLAAAYVFTILRTLLRYRTLPDLNPDEILAAEETGLSGRVQENEERSES
jgi:TRAP-type C4-dicarboxylate transport system permease small subunit